MVCNVLHTLFYIRITENDFTQSSLSEMIFLCYKTHSSTFFVV